MTDGERIVQGEPIQGEHEPLMKDTLAGIPLYGDSADPAVAAKFVQSGYKDLWAAGIFVVHVVACGGWALYNYVHFREKFLQSGH